MRVGVGMGGSLAPTIEGSGGLPRENFNFRDAEKCISVHFDQPGIKHFSYEDGTFIYPHLLYFISCFRHTYLLRSTDTCHFG